MGLDSKIEWCAASWNPWMGCKKVSPGCKNCYMFRDMTFYGKDPNVVRRAADSTFRNPLKWAKSGKLAAGSRIFTCSWSDWFIEQADEWRPEAWEIIRQTPQYNYLILTKRIERAEQCLPSDWGYGYPNVWLGVSVESQAYVKRAYDLLCIPAAVHWVSAEPLLGDVKFRGTIEHIDGERRVRWIVTGGESDKTDPRKCELDWLRNIRDDCSKNGVAFFHKQHGGSKKINGHWGGRELDGRTHDEFPV